MRGRVVAGEQKGVGLREGDVKIVSAVSFLFGWSCGDQGIGREADCRGRRSRRFKRRM
jgi:hypothetical protein